VIGGDDEEEKAYFPPPHNQSNNNDEDENVFAYNYAPAPPPHPQSVYAPLGDALRYYLARINEQKYNSMSIEEKMKEFNKKLSKKMKEFIAHENAARGVPTRSGTAEPERVRSVIDNFYQNWRNRIVADYQRLSPAEQNIFRGSALVNHLLTEAEVPGRARIRYNWDVVNNQRARGELIGTENTNSYSVNAIEDNEPEENENEPINEDDSDEQ